MDLTRNECFEILGVQQDADFQQIRKAFKKKALEWHPDKHPAENKQKAEEMFKKVVRAYEMVSGADKAQDFIEDAFEDFFKNFFRSAGNASSFRDDESSFEKWHSEEAKKERFERRKHLWEQEDALTEDERKNRHMSNNIFNVEDLPCWSQDPQRDSARTVPSFFRHDPDLEAKISLYKGGIYNIRCDAVCNATDIFLSGGGGLDSAMHKMAGRFQLAEELLLLDGCPTGYCEISRGYCLPAKYIIHCVGPMNRDATKLASCYNSALEMAVEHKIRTLAFPCIATGCFGFPLEASAQIALQTVRRWLEIGDNRTKIDRIVFVMYRTNELQAYGRWISSVFPAMGSIPIPEMVKQLQMEGEGEEVEIFKHVTKNDEFLDPWLSKALEKKKKKEEEKGGEGKRRRKKKKEQEKIMDLKKMDFLLLKEKKKKKKKKKKEKKKKEKEKEKELNS
eukprot:CAMPEP_0201526336 /NCGR_PEP_ID=MMETSP0161_2-20130828/31480_1 /ASSEMBLY_ACC=CAM_ASM_000251 /TAXON_ID=180227 /ORGANISM="Neoparamoeba aestuarina, Strain SoJaBio B1-5/56/2" /LENGTH=449 /DNA_ID=CAMNT_0047926683 /DNA_START=33 /DNA_END=1379 /DNA_ORIENTATION=-